MDNTTLDKVLSGNLDNLIPLPKRVVRLFISSTFTDMTLERNSLMERVYPKLKNYCREQYGLDFQVVDMRWGVRDEATDDHQTVDLCSREIRNCQRMSLGPNFVALIGDKYGFRPLCNRIKSSEYRALRRCLIELDMNTDFLDTWYKEDLNAVPAEYLLQPISSILKNFTNKAEPELQSVDQRIWQAIQERIHELLLIGSGRLVAQGRLSVTEQLMRYSISVTEREVIEGCLDVNDAKQRCLVYVRSIDDLRDHLQKCLDNLASFNVGAGLVDPAASTNQQATIRLSPTVSSTNDGDQGEDASKVRRRSRSDSQPRRASLKIGSDSINLTTSQSQNAAERRVERTRKLLGRYIDLIAADNVWRLDEEAQRALRDLKENKLTKKLRLSGKNLNKFEIKWQEQEGMSLKSEEHKRYLNDLTEHFYKNLQSMIRKSARSSEQQQQQQQLKSSGLLGEVLQHSHYACHVSRGFSGRTKELAQLKGYILGHHPSKRRVLPMFIYGVGGSGKTSLLARAATLIDNWTQEQRQQQPRRQAASNETISAADLPCVISRFCGTTPSSSSMVGVLGSVCRQLQYNFHQFGPLSGADRAADQSSGDAQLASGQIPDDFVRLVFRFRQLLDNCPHKLHRQRLFVIILDSLEHLSADRCSVEVKYSWLTSLGNLPPNLRLIVSCSSEASVTTNSWRLDFAHLKRHFLASYFDLEREMSSSCDSVVDEAAESNRNTCDAHPEQRLVEEGCEKESKTEERLHSLRLTTISAVCNTQCRADEECVNREWSPNGQQRPGLCGGGGILHIRPLGSEWARRVLQSWLGECGRNLTPQQWSIVEKSFASCSRPIFVKLAFGEVINWKSYSMQSDTRGLTFGSSLLEKQPPTTDGRRESDRHQLAGSLMGQQTRPTGDDDDKLFRWQLVCMEQEWLSYLEFKAREEAAAAAAAAERRGKSRQPPKNNHNMTIRIGGGGAKSPSDATTATTTASICHLSTSIDDAICQLFARIEVRHGFLLTKHSLSYLTAARNGICENELEDLLSLDDVVLDDVFQYHLPPVRRVPPLLWARIRSDLPDYLSERDADGTFVVDWHHGQFRLVARRRYLSDRQQVAYIHSMMADYFIGRWADKPKPFKCTKQQAQMAAEQLESAIQQSLRDSQSLGGRGSGIGADRPSAGAGARLSFGAHSSQRIPGGSSISVHNRLRSGSNQNDQRFQWMQAKADRRVPHQPLFFSSSTKGAAVTGAEVAKAGDSARTATRRYNLRKLTELPHHLIRAGRFDDLANEVLFNYRWLFCSLDALGLPNVLSDFDDASRAISLEIVNLKSRAHSLSTAEIAVRDESGKTLREEHEDGDDGEENVEFLESILRQIGLLSSAIRLSSGSIAHGRTRMLAPQLLGRLLPQLVVPNNNNKKQQLSGKRHLSQLLEQCDRDGSLDNALLPIAHCLQSPEGLQSGSLEGHSFAVMAMALTNDQRHLLAVSNKFIMWDISTGELSRHIEPKIDESIMLGLRLGADNKYALAYTSNNLILLLDILTQQVTSYKELAADGTTTTSSSSSIRCLELIDKQEARRFIVGTQSRWFMFSVVIAADDLTHANQRGRLSIELEFSAQLAEFSSLSEPSRRIHFLRAAEQDENKFILVIGTRPFTAETDDGLFRISTFAVVRRELGANWSLELWSDKIENVSAFCLNESLSQLIYVDAASLHLKRRRQMSWSKAKLLTRGDDDTGRWPVLSLQTNNLGAETPDRRQNIEMIQQLRAYERTIDDNIQWSSSGGETIEGCSAFVDLDVDADVDTGAPTDGAAVVMLHETFVTVLLLGNRRSKLEPFFSRSQLPKDVRNIQVEPNRCQMESLVMRSCAGQGTSGEKLYLILSFHRRLLFYSLDRNLNQGKLVKSIEAHGARIVQLLPISKNNNSKDAQLLVASASLDKSVKLWNLANLANNSQSLDKLDSPISAIGGVCSQTGLAVCLGRNECGLFDWRTLRLLAKLQTPQVDAASPRLVKSRLSSSGRYLCLASLDSLYLYTLASSTQSSAGRQAPLETVAISCSPSDITCSKFHPINSSSLGRVRKLVFFQQDSRMLATFVCPHRPDDYDDDDDDDDGREETSTSHSGRDGRLGRRLLIVCFSIPDGRPLYTIDHLTPSSLDRPRRAASQHPSGRDDGAVRLPVLTRDQAHIVTVEFSSQNQTDADNNSGCGGGRRRTSSTASEQFPLQLSVYSSRDGKLSHSIVLSDLEISNQQSATNRRDSSIVQATMMTTPTNRRVITKRWPTISSDQFTKLKSIQYFDRQSVVALINGSGKQQAATTSYLIDLHQRQLIVCSSAWNGSRLTSDGRFGLSRTTTVASEYRYGKSSQTMNDKTQRDSASERPTVLLQLLEMRQCTPIRVLLTTSDIEPGGGGGGGPGNRSGPNGGSLDDEIVCGFNGPDDRYAYYCDQQRRRILLVRLADGRLVANYSLAAALVALKWADGGQVLVAGLDDGSLLSLAIVDQENNDNNSSSSLLRLSQYPSRKPRPDT